MIDAHLHLQHIPRKRVLESILAEAPAREVDCFFCNAIKLADCELLSELAAEHDSIIPFYGAHPWEVPNLTEGWDRELESYMAEPGCGVGEIGLDKARDIDFTAQKDVFTRQIELAGQYRKPVMIHVVRAWGEVLPVLRKCAGSTVFLIHAFRGSVEVLEELVDLGAYVTFSWKLFKQKYGEPVSKVKSLIRIVPEDRLLLETDFPYIGEKVFSTLTAEKYFECLDETYHIAAALLDRDVEDLKNQTRRNGSAFLSLPSSNES